MSRIKRQSLKRKVVVLWAWVFVIIFLISIYYGFYIFNLSMQSTLESIRYTNQSYLENISRDISDLRQSANSIYHNNNDFRRLAQSALDDFEWYSTSYRLSQVLDTKVQAISYPGGMFFYDAAKDTLRSSFNASMAVGNKYLLDQGIRNCLLSGAELNDTVYFQTEDKVYLCYAISLKDCSIGLVYDPESYVKHAENMQVLINTGAKIVDANSYTPWNDMDSQTSFWSKRRITLFREAIPDTPLTMIMLQQTDSYWNILRKPQIISSVIFIPLVLLLLLGYMLHLFKQTLLYPVELLVDHVSRIQHRETEPAVPPHAKPFQNIEEYRQLNDAIESQLDKISQLREQKYQQEQEANWARLQYYQLQINPHFYLNCLNTISMLIDRGNTVAAGDMIRDLSSHFRYVFQDQRQFVSLGEELAEVRSLCNIYSLRAGMPILLNEEVEPRYLNIQIPPLTLQTFVENSVKHRDDSGRILNIIIRHEQLNDCTKIYIKDNGNGYTEEELENFNRPVDRFIYQSDHVGIDNFKFRMKLLYQDKASFAFYNSPVGGAVCEITIWEVFDEHLDH